MGAAGDVLQIPPGGDALAKPCVMVSTELWDHPRAVALGRALADDGAWRYLVMLWGWGLEADNVSGVIDLTPRRIAGICSYAGDPDHFVSALVDTGWLIPTEQVGVYAMRGWARNAAFFKERERLRNRYAWKNSRGKDATLPRERRDSPAGKTRPSYTYTKSNKTNVAFDEQPKQRSLILEAEPDGSESSFALVSLRGGWTEIDRVLEHYLAVFPRRRRQAQSAKVRRLVARWLDKYSGDELREAIDGWVSSRFHREHNHTHLALIFRDETHIDRFIELKHRPAPDSRSEAAVLAVTHGPILAEPEGSLWQDMRTRPSGPSAS